MERSGTVEPHNFHLLIYFSLNDVTFSILKNSVTSFVTLVSPLVCKSGYEIHGMEKIPDMGPALIVYYHGAIPIDYYYFLASVIIQKGRTCHSVADHFIFKIPGVYAAVCDMSGYCTPGGLLGPRETPTSYSKIAQHTVFSLKRRRLKLHISTEH